jgi:hypothetical protein
MNLSIFNGNKNHIIIPLATTFIIWIIFKLAYPYPDFFSDSYSYMEAAASHRDINIWPIGYSKFLGAFHNITISDTALVTFQYGILEIGCMYFFLSLNYLVKIRLWQKVILFIFLFVNPFFLYVSNYVSSDALFCALTLIWITDLIWILYKPNPYRIIIPTLCTFLAFTMRYNAMYYPFITILVLTLSKQKLWSKILGSMLILPLLICFYLYSRDAGERLTGKPIWSILSGWQWANNALYMRGFINVDSAEFPNQACRDLDRLSQAYFKFEGTNIENTLVNNQGNYFIQYMYSPLKVYMYQNYPPSGVAEWGKVSPLYSQYGLSLIEKHPVGYFRYYLWLNTGNYFLPSLEKLEIYNLGQDHVWDTGVKWFQYKSNKIRCISPILQGRIMPFFSFYFLLLNLAFLFVTVLTMTNSGFWKTNTCDRNLTLILVGFWLANFGFSIFANIIVLRYQLFPMILITAGSLIMAEIYLFNPKSRKAPSPPIAILA